MSEQQAPDRTVRGFSSARHSGGVHPDARRLLARNRPAASVDPSVAQEVASEAPTSVAMTGAVAASRGVVANSQRVEAASTRQAGVTPVSGVKAQVNVMVPVDLRARIRSAYRATSVQEGHRSFSDFVASLLEAEASRLEARYNDSRRFGGGQQPLTPGRPLDT